MDPDALIRVGGFERGWGVLWGVLCEGLVFVDPFLASAVHEDRVLAAVVLEVPDCVCCEPVVEVAVGDYLSIVRDSMPAEQLLCLLLPPSVALQELVALPSRPVGQR